MTKHERTGFVESPIRLDDQRPDAGAVPEGEPEPSRILADPALDRAKNRAATHLDLELFRRKAELIRKIVRPDRDVRAPDPDDRSCPVRRRTLVGRARSPH